MKFVWAVLLFIGAGVAQANPLSPAHYADAFEICLAENPAPDCSRTVYIACLESGEVVPSTFGMTACLNIEGELWEMAISREVTRATHLLRAQDAENRQFFEERFSGAAEALAASQALWTAWLEAECNLEYAEWGSGSHRVIVYGDCILTLSAARFERLRAIGTESAE